MEYVTNNSVKSDKESVKYELQQLLILGPLMILLYNNDLNAGLYLPLPYLIDLYIKYCVIETQIICKVGMLWWQSVSFL